MVLRFSHKNIEVIQFLFVEFENGMGGSFNKRDDLHIDLKDNTKPTK